MRLDARVDVGSTSLEFLEPLDLDLDDGLLETGIFGQNPLLNIIMLKWYQLSLLKSNIILDSVAT